MNQSVLSAKNGILAQQRRLDSIASNISNVNTYGFKGSRVDFRDIIYQTMARPVQPQLGANQERGHGVVSAMNHYNLNQGAVETTGQPLDFLISGPGYFAVQDQNGDIRYTREGAFRVSVEGDGNYLMTSSGMYVLDENGQRINLPNGSLSVNVRPDGTITTGEEDTFVARFGVYTFPDLDALEEAGENTMIPSITSGGPIAVPAGTRVIQGSLEMSNVDLGTEMTRMIRTQRALQAASRAITTADGMDGTANGMRV